MCFLAQLNARRLGVHRDRQRAAVSAGVRRRRQARGWGWVTPPVGRALEIRKFIKASSLETCSEIVSGGDAGCWRGSRVACFLGYLLGKNIGGVVVLISFRLTWDGCSSHLPFGGVLSFRSEAREVLGSETARVHHAARRCGGRGERAIPGCESKFWLLVT